LNPRTLMAQPELLTRATCTPGTRRRASGIEVAPDRIMSSFVSTKIAAGASPNLSGIFETDTTVAPNSCSGDSAKGSTSSAAKAACAAHSTLSAAIVDRNTVCRRRPKDLGVALGANIARRAMLTDSVRAKSASPPSLAPRFLQRDERVEGTIAMVINVITRSSQS